MLLLHRCSVFFSFEYSLHRIQNFPLHTSREGTSFYIGHFGIIIFCTSRCRLIKIVWIVTYSEHKVAYYFQFIVVYLQFCSSCYFINYVTALHSLLPKAGCVASFLYSVEWVALHPISVLCCKPSIMCLIFVKYE